MSEQSTPSQPTRRAGLFDLRMIIALLFGIYGVVLTVVGLGFTTKADLDKAGGINVNLWCGAGMLALTLGFVTWVRLRPLRVPEQSRREQTRPEQTRPEQTRPEQTRPELARPELARPEAASPASTKQEPEPEEPAEPADAG